MIAMNCPKFLIVDLFCGAGGTTLGFVQACDGIAKVIACVNHDHKAIRSHWENHPEVKHFEEDIRTLDIGELVGVVRGYRRRHPGALIILWASLECTNFSKAKGGLPRDADSRTLANHLFRYVEGIDPDYVQIENVVEFMAWGPLDRHGKPISMKKGRSWLKWRKHMCSFGYKDDWKELNAANYGAYTSRNRLFGVFYRPGLPIAWPNQTHAKDVCSGEMFQMKKWKPVKDVLDFSDEGISIFGRKKALVPKTMKRIYAGLVKYVAGGEDVFLSKYFSGNPNDKNIPTSGPAGTITTKDHHSVVFLTKYFGQGGGQLGSIEDPSSTLTTKDRTAKVRVKYWIDKQYNGDNQNHQSVDRSVGTIAANDKHAVVKAECFIDRQFSQGQKNQSVDKPAGSLLTVPKMSLVKIKRFIMDTSFGNGPRSVYDPMGTITANRKHHYIVNPSWGTRANSSMDKPCPTLIARQDKAPLYLIGTDPGEFAIPVFEEDCEYTIKIKEFMVLYGISDIKMRMLKVPELLSIQGFPRDYRLSGTKTDQKKFIGNSVVPVIVKLWIEEIYKKLTPIPSII